jgi:hypothetical protein
VALYDCLSQNELPEVGLKFHALKQRQEYAHLGHLVAQGRNLVFLDILFLSLQLSRYIIPQSSELL